MICIVLKNSDIFGWTDIEIAILGSPVWATDTNSPVCHFYFSQLVSQEGIGQTDLQATNYMLICTKNVELAQQKYEWNQYLTKYNIFCGKLSLLK